MFSSRPGEAGGSAGSPRDPDGLLRTAESPRAVGRCQVGDWWGWLAGLVGALVLLAIALVSSRRVRRAAGKGETAGSPLVPESDVEEVVLVDVWVPATWETAVSLRRLLGGGKDALVVVDPGPGGWTLDAALLASRRRRAQEALADRLEELASIAGKDVGAVTVRLGRQSPVATALDALRRAHPQPLRPIPPTGG